jgi:phosphotransferase system  glucose/maltose/N-acetylglucosamine-specific IIC component
MTFLQHAWRVLVVAAFVAFGGLMGYITTTASGPEQLAGSMLIAIVFAILGTFVTYFLLNQDLTDRPGRPSHGQRF